MKALKIKKSQIGTCFTTKEDYLVYKKVRGSTLQMRFGEMKGIAVLWIPKGSKIVVASSYKLGDSGHNVKLRSNVAVCLGILPYSNYEYQSFDKSHKFCALKNAKFTYSLGKVLIPERTFNDSVHNMCKSGIHFFEKLSDAESY